MNLVYASAAALLALMAASSGMLSPDDGEDPFQVSSINVTVEGENRFKLLSNGGGTNCSVAAGAAIDDAKRPLRLGAACLDINPGFANARYWMERPDGSVAFAKQDGDVVAEFSVADGAAFESYYPSQPIMILLAGD